MWKRYNLRTRSNAEPAVNVDGREEDETLEEAEDEDGAPKRAVKRRCLDGAQEEEVEGGGVGKTGNFVGTLWEKGVEFLKRKSVWSIAHSHAEVVSETLGSVLGYPFWLILVYSGKLARRTSDEKSDPRIDLNEVGASPLHAEVDGHLDPPLGGAPLDEASDQDLPRARELSSEPQQLPKPPSPKRSPRVSRHANGTDSTQERDPESNLLSRGLLEGSFPSQPLLGSPEFSGSDETSIDTSDSVDTHIVENVAPGMSMLGCLCHHLFSLRFRSLLHRLQSG